MIDQIDFIEKHKRLREASETVLLMESPRRWGKSWVGMQLTKQRPAGKVGEFYLGSWSDFSISRRKLLQSSSKQSRIISVVCK